MRYASKVGEMDDKSKAGPHAALLRKAHEICSDYRERFGVKGNTAGVQVY